MLEVRAVEVFYGDLQALWGTTLAVHQGEVVALIGPNGAGKTTLMRTITGLSRPTRGSVVLDGESLERVPAHGIVERGVVLVPEGRRLFGEMTVLENLEMGAFSRRARQRRASTLANVFEIFPILAERRRQLAASLSGGQQQMVAIGRALMGLPRLLLLDEPSLGLAPLVVQDIFGVLRRVNENGVTVLLVEQNARLALELADRGYVLEQGRVVGEGSGAALLADEAVRQAYLGYVTVEGAGPTAGGCSAEGRGVPS
jgi:branched-chain amino acid transport system ATP-binding protein